MLPKRIVDLVHQVTKPSGLDAYLNSVHQRGLAGEPTYDEARKDFVQATKQEAGYLLLR